jgi:hypothetical protein
MATTTTTPTRSGSESRFYQLEMRNRAVLKGDIGSLIRIDGLVVAGGGARQVLMLPSASREDDIEENDYVWLTDEAWTEFLQRSDVPEILVGPAKAFHRKARYEISGLVQQKVWAADGFKCMFCGRTMGDVQLSVDHLIPLELGGVNDTSNYISACRRCNKDKGSEDPRTWCERKNVDYDVLVAYLKARRV